MPELRKDPVTGTWVIVSPERKIRPQYFIGNGLTEENCPFCEGNESMTPPEIYALRDKHSHANKKGWSLRVIPNKYPALKVEGNLDKRGEGFYDLMNGVGAHEVVIETAAHSKGIDEMETTETAEVFLAFKRRITDLKRDVRFKYIQVFKNHERMAGATIPHPHSQIVAMPVLPIRVQERLEHAETHFKAKDRCIFCDIIHHEQEYHKRVLMENSDFIVVSPFAAKLPFELVLYPRDHHSSFEDMDDTIMLSLAEIFKDTMTRVNKALERPAYNLMLHNAPFDRDCKDYFHWHLEIMPMITGTGGFELSTATYINPTPPEEAVGILREQG
jgi:UDPglucose--hexose-1-phosphate uridylyltransferase